MKLSQQMAPREIIVIESDSEDSICRKKKETARLESSTAPSEDLIAGPSDKDIFGVPSELLYPAIPCVGASSGALHVQQQSSAMLEPDQSNSMFSISAPLVEDMCTGSCSYVFCTAGKGLNITYTDLTKSNQSKSIMQETESVVAEQNSAEDLAVEFTIGEWCIADDELAAPETSDDSASVDEGEPYNEYSCPVCGMDLTGTSLVVS